MKYGLFRGRQVNSSKWAYGYYTELYGAGCICAETDEKIVCFSESDNLVISDAVDINNLVVNYTVDNDTVGPWTGKTDVNGVKIFESDIVDFADDPELPPERGVVKWDAENAQFVITLSESQAALLGWFDGLKVIGNVFDNPELLNGNLE